MLAPADSLRTFFAQEFQPLRLRGRASNTLRLYLTTLNNFDLYLSRPALLSDLTDDTVCRFLSWFRGRGRSPYSANKERSNLLAVWRFACRRRRVVDWPNVDPDAEPVDDPLAWTESELSALFAALASQPGTIGGIPAADWWQALHAVLWDTGERIGAVLLIQWQHVDLRRGYVAVPAANRKGGRKGRTYRLHAETVAMLRRMRTAAVALVFPWPWSATYLWNRYAKILHAAGLPSDRKSKFHRMRRSVASWFEAAGHNSTEFLGHSSRKVTRAYLDPRIVHATHAADVLFRPTATPG